MTTEESAAGYVWQTGFSATAREVSDAHPDLRSSARVPSGFVGGGHHLVQRWVGLSPVAVHVTDDVPAVPMTASTAELQTEGPAGTRSAVGKAR